MITNNNSSLPPYYDIKSWLSTKENIEDYSKINDTYHISCCKQDIRHNDKLLLLEFIVLKYSHLSDDKYIAHDLRIIRTVKDGTIFCENPSFIYLESSETMDGIIAKRINSQNYLAPNGLIIDSPFYLQFESYPTINRRISLYTIKLHSEDLLNNIKNIKKKPIPSLRQLCIYSIATDHLKHYNKINRKMDVMFEHICG